MSELSTAKQTNKSGNRRGLNPLSLANLQKGRKFKKGESGNPKGRTPKAACITSLIRDMLDQPVKEGEKLTWRESIARAILSGASTGNPALVKELLERLEGRVTQPIEGGIEITDARSLSEEELDQLIQAELSRITRDKEKPHKSSK